MRIFHVLWKCVKGIFDFINTYFKVVVLLLIVLFLVALSNNEKIESKPNLAKLYLNFPIYESETFATQVEAIKANDDIKGVLLLIDSPGGAVGASIEIAEMIKDLNEKIPVVAYTQSLMASGSYYAGMYAHSIYANRGALVGSIGVIFSAPNFEELMSKIGVKMQGSSAGEYKEIGTITRRWNPLEKDFINNLIQEQYKMFYNDVLEARGEKLKVKNPLDFAEGKIFSANNALRLGLIDGIGNMNEAIKVLQSLSGVEEIVWLKKDKMEVLLDKFVDSIVSKAQMFALPKFMWSM
ncbi:signal peptide peptidase SppA [Helicobacter trogontum]|uniref:Signal peptide peptidase SppA n=1 Tax=Helicobacter trogontum TaxID=50960 RepID=A0A4U8SAP6_9HELI|nr:signal peptide peptidase SppA [Helicobacter trogontum]TLD83158.1 signal peptide peptidase SppA [Helicobacter trogontum]